MLSLFFNDLKFLNGHVPEAALLGSMLGELVADLLDQLRHATNLLAYLFQC